MINIDDDNDPQMPDEATDEESLTADTDAEDESADGDAADEGADAADKEQRKSASWLRRYVSLLTLGVMAAIVYMLFFSDTSVLHKIEYQRIIDSLQTEVEINRDSMLYYKELNSRLSSDPEVMERVVREQHNMKRPDEDVYVFTAE